MNDLTQLLDRNRAWAEAVKEKEAEFFLQLSRQQAPEILWIGCSDSRVAANQIVNLPPGQVFVHRNIANVVVHSDLNCLSVIQFAVELLKVKHIIVCGHEGCAGIRAAMDETEHGLIDNWLGHIKDVARLNADTLQGLTLDRKCDLLCELNVIEQVRHVCETTIVQNAWKSGADLSVNGWIYNIEDGILRDLNSTFTSLGQL